MVGRTAYELKLGFTPSPDAANTIVDTTGEPLDGDRDGQAGASFNFWFVTASVANTIYVDKLSPSVGSNGSLSNPYNTINSALAAASGSTRVIRIVGNSGNAATFSDDQAYLIGTDLQGQSLADGSTFNVPVGVTVMIDEGSLFKLRASVIDVGSSSPIVSRAGASIQVLGTTQNQVQFTSYHNDLLGGNTDGVGPTAVGGQWGGIVLRKDSDSSTKKLFLNSISQAKFTYGGGNVYVDSQLQSFSPIHLESTRPTLSFNEIANSAGAAISADPNSFEDSNGHTVPRFGKSHRQQHHQRSVCSNPNEFRKPNRQTRRVGQIQEHRHRLCDSGKPRDQWRRWGIYSECHNGKC